VKPFSWRKNRRPTGDSTWGVDLNRNWAPKWHAEVPSELAAELRDPRSPEFAGERPFSEPETRAVRDLLLRHPEMALFLDYHSGFAPFLQGGVGFPIPPSEVGFPSGHRVRLEELSAGLAAAVSDPGDERPGFVVNKERDVAKTLESVAPWWARAFVPESIPSPPGTSGEWVYGELGVVVIGLEIMRDWNYFRRLPGARQRLLESQLRGLLYLLEEFSRDPFDPA
jgi:hypothetical protein